MAPDTRVKILIVDDHPENLMALEAVLKDLGQELVKAQSGREALRHLLHEDVAVILLDVQMPDMDGFETAALVRERERLQHTPIIFLTAINKSDRHVFKGYSLGAVDYIFKPFEPEVLKAKVAVFIDLYRKTEEITRQSEMLITANEELDRLNEELEQRVKERTAQLTAANQELAGEISERKRVEQERELLLKKEQESRRQAEVANRLKDEFLATLSHELRTPLSSILGWTRLLQGGKLDVSGTDRAIETIERNAKAQAQLINDLLDISRIMAGKVIVNISPTSLGPVIEAAINSIMPAAQAKDIKLEVEISPSDRQVLGDTARLQQVIWNLLSNAVKFTPQGGYVKAELRYTDRTAEILISDNGQGIKLEFLPYVFDRFRQADGSSTRRHGGLGIGLAIVRHLIEMHGGTVRADSEGEGLGASFVIELPLATAYQDSGWEEHILPEGETGNGAMTLSGVRVLIVDDEPDTLEMLRTALSCCGADVRAASTAGEAYDHLQQWRPNVLVSDIGMPGEDGYSLISRIRALSAEQGGTTPAVALTAYARDEERIRALSAGFQMHLAKPIEPSVVAASVASLAAVRSHSSSEANF